MLKGRKLAFCLVVCLLSSVLAACLPQKPVPDDVIGLWVERYEDDDVRTPVALCAAYFRFFPDGRFEAHNIPARFFYGKGPRVDTSGTWRLDTTSNDPFALHKIHLRFAPIPGEYGVTTSVVFPIGSRDVFWTFVERPSATFGKEDEARCQ